MEDGPLKRCREGAKAAFVKLIDPQEHVQGFASVGRQKEGVPNARQEFCGHYLDLCATYWELDRLPQAREYGRTVVDSVVSVMAPDGYIGGETPDRIVKGFSLWNQAHATYGLLRYAAATENATALELGRRAADWLLATQSAMPPERLVDPKLVGNGGSQHLTAFYAFDLAEEAFGVRKYGDYVRQTLEGLERTKMNFLSNPDCLALQSRKGIEMLNAWRGILAYARRSGNAPAVAACRRYWRSIADTQIRNTGAATDRERFLPDGNAPRILPIALKPNENCVQCGWLRFTRELFAATGDARCAAEMEKTLYNHILGSMATDGSDFAYYQGNVGQKAFRKNAVYQCCRYRGYAVMAHLPELIWDDNGTQVTPLVYAPLSYRAEDGLSVRVSTDYPRAGRIEIEADSPRQPRELRLPIPSWCREWSLVRDGETAPSVERDGFVVVRLAAGTSMRAVLNLRMDFMRRPCRIDGKAHAEYAYGPLVLVRDTSYGDRLGEPLPEDLPFGRNDADCRGFVRFDAAGANGRRHVLVDYASACRKDADKDCFEVFLPLPDDGR